jgi:hypothetical protein
MFRGMRNLLTVGILALGVGTASAQFGGGGFGGGAYGLAGYGGGFGGGFGGYYPGAYGGYMQGLASVTNANGQYQMQIQQARVEQQQAEQARNKTRLDWDKTRIEETNLRSQEATANREYRENVREQARQETLNWSRKDPPAHYIYEGVALNAIADEIKQLQLDSSLRGPQVLVDQEILNRINVNDGTSNSAAAGLGVIKPNGSLNWPVIMRSRDFEPIRKVLDQQVAGAIRMVRSDSLDAETYTALQKEADKLQKYIDSLVGDMRPDDYIRANRFSTSLEKDVVLLGGDNAKKYFSGDFKLSGSSVAEVLDNMFKSGLKFAAAGDADRQAYNAFYNSLLQYDAGLQQLAGPAKPAAPGKGPAFLPEP